MYYLKRTFARINLNNLIYNARSYQSALPNGTQLMCVVKANAYGHGVKAVTKCLQNDLGVKWFGVSNIDEAVELRENGISGEILILGCTPPSQADRLIKYNIIQACLDLDYAEALDKAASGKVRVHIKLDTGMSRIGILCDDTSSAVCEAKKIYELDNLSVEGIFTHLCVADSKKADNISFTDLQIKKIKSVCDALKAQGCDPGVCHWLNSAGGIYTKSDGSALARLGIILYGLYPNHSLAVPVKMKPVMELISTVSMVKTVKKGSDIGYGRTFTANVDMRIATVAAGYADGFPRLLSNKGEVIINGRRCRIVGNVCMDQFMADVTGLDVKPGDSVTLIGQSGSEKITADDIADLCHTIGYEITCGITKRVPRVILKDGKEIGVE